MTTALPGYATPSEQEQELTQFEIGSPDALGWRPLGAYLSADEEFDWRIPTFTTIELDGNHPLAAYLAGCRRKVIHLRYWENGIQWTGRVMNFTAEGKPGQETITITCVSYVYWLMRGLAWVNNQLPPTVQINITGKQDVRFGPIDLVAKSYLASIFTRLNRPVYAALPIRYPVPTLPDLEDINTLDDLLGIIDEATEELVVLSARFTQLDELLKQEVERLDLGLSCDLWTPADGTESPHVFNTQNLAQLQSVLDFTSDNFLNFTNPDNILGLADPDEWGKMQSAGYVFDTHVKRDMRQMQWRSDGGQIEHIKRHTKHMDADTVIVGGKAPEIMNQVIEWGANFAIQLLLNAIAPGLGLGLIVGDLFDDIFFAYQQFFDPDVESDPNLGVHCFAEVMADNTAAYSADSAAVGLAALKAHAGTDAVTITVTVGGPDGRGFTFGADDGSGKRFRCGDIMTLWHMGTTIEQFVSNVKITSRPGARKQYAVTLGDAETMQDGWERVISRLQGAAGTFRGIANSI